ncbi:dihydrodipicolinate synthase family protein [Cellulomonas chitinilytica]|uniref:Dihydrodipicolinate synthase family protein n=1 Tax=Cellulomonas chitinilytica TaxID=398759 RepID=A0A919U1K7_9CELL|nr:dihydrodipicolinate synthase family protein [Cellulomonas chitinilytica]GIG23258.1 dihydrodipicolinate synthase family protein [Cellulomonas chitinilytica]
MPLLGPLVVYPPTPRTVDGDVAEEALAALVDRAVDAGVDGIAVLGSTGGAAYLDRARRRRVVEVAAEAVAGRVPLVAGVGATTTEAVIAHSDDAVAAGADALLLGTVSYLPLTDDEVVGLFADVTRAVDRPVWAYHNPTTTRFSFTVETLLRVAALPGVGGVKDRGIDAAELRARAARLLADAPTTVEVGFSGDLLGVEGLLAGARTWHTGLASVLPGPYVALARAGAAGDRAEVDRLLDAVRPVVELALAHGGPRVVHAIGEILGLGTGRLPAPLLPPAHEVVTRLEQMIPELVGTTAAP